MSLANRASRLVGLLRGLHDSALRSQRPSVIEMADRGKDAVSRLSEFLYRIDRDLARTMEFWQKHSHDDEFGGFFTCLDPDGHRYDDVKYCWLQSRQVWTYARLYNEMERYRTPEILETAVKGAKFLQTHVRDPTTYRCCFSVTRDGKPIKYQRTIFSECFYLMAMSELGRATGEKTYKEEALKMMEKIVYWVRVDDSELGRPKLAGAPEASSLAVPMMLLCLIDQLETMDKALTETYQDLTTWCLDRTKSHVQRNGSVVLENVSLEGQELGGCQGRLMNPGHAIEAGWFLLRLATKSGDEALKQLALDSFIGKSFERGWDKEHGGIFYFLDVDNWSPTVLEWDQKLWWPHCEAMVAFLMAYSHTKDVAYLQHFQTVFDYTYSHFVDQSGEEWFGYLSRQGAVHMNFKGGPWKGCFHVPRFQLMCLQMLQSLVVPTASS